MHGALLVDKPAGISSFGVVEKLQWALRNRGIPRKELPKIGHGGTLDPFATGLLVVCVGRAVKVARYFLGSDKGYEGTFRFGETTLPGDPTAPVSERSEVLPVSLEKLREVAASLSRQPYLQTPPMFSAKKKDGKPLYELARQGIEVERDPKLCHLYDFEVRSYQAPCAEFSVRCSSGTYIRTLAQDYARLNGSVGMLDSLRRTASGIFKVSNALTLDQILQATAEGTPWDELPCWQRFDELLGGFDRANATRDEAAALLQGRGSVLFNILKRAEPGTAKVPAVEPSPLGTGDGPALVIYCDEQLVAVARSQGGVWGLERVFSRSEGQARS